VLGSQLAAELPARAAGGVKSRFFEGQFIQGPYDGFFIQIGVAGARARGSALSGPFVGATATIPLAGMLLGSQLTLSIYATADDGGGDTPIGTMTGTLDGSSLRGSYSLNSGGKGEFFVRLLRANKKSMKKFSGIYDGELNLIEGFAPGWKARTVIKPNGNWELSDVVRPDGTSADVRFAGVYSVPVGSNLAVAAGLTPLVAMLLPRSSKSVRGISGGERECCCCHSGDKDQDGINDASDDSDGDGILDLSDHDFDNDGVDDDADPDDDDDGVPDGEDEYPYSTEDGRREALEAMSLIGIVNFRIRTSGRKNVILSTQSPSPGGTAPYATGQKRGH
jgi:hypothetical protein